ncbi:MAG: hypothetical protein HY302_15770 [Opitutae bacterium]|nr:hypothetical protein [Opitutae bacterium]
MVWLDTIENIPKSEIGAFVQKCIDEGALAVVVTRSNDGGSYTINVRRE